MAEHRVWIALLPGLDANGWRDAETGSVAWEDYHPPATRRRSRAAGGGVESNQDQKTVWEAVPKR